MEPAHLRRRSGGNMDLLRQSRAAVLIATVALAGAIGAPAHAIDAGSRFVSVAFHDVVDTPGELDGDAVTVDRLIAFFEWLRGNGWTAITLDDLAAAQRGKPL